MHEDSLNSPWMCTVCDKKFAHGSGIACALCYQVACQEHIRINSIYSPETGLFELKQVCLNCLFKKQLES